MAYQNVHPMWIHFFERETYLEYQNFVKTRDFTKILSPLRTEKSTTSQEGETSHPADVSIYAPDAVYSEIAGDCPPPPVLLMTAAEIKARRKRTRTYVVLGILVMSLVAMLVAVLLHFHVQKSLFGGAPPQVNTSSFPPQQSQRTNHPQLAYPTRKTGAKVNARNSYPIEQHSHVQVNTTAPRP